VEVSIYANDMTYTISFADIDSLPQVFPQVKDYLEGAMEYAPEYSLEDIVSSILEGDSQLFVISNEEEVVGAAVTVLEKHPRRSYVQIHLLGGKDINGWANVLREKLKEYAAGLGYDGLCIHARKGWQKVFPDLKCERVIMMDLIGEEHG
jgi:hypothetical protein